MAIGTNLKKQQMEYIGVGALVVLALFMGLSKFKKKEVDDEVFSRKEFNKRWKEIEILEKNIPRAEKEIKYNVDVDRPPFKSPFEEEKELKLAGEGATLPTMIFQGMVWNSARPQAIINNKIYDINDIIEITSVEEKSAGIKIKDIRKDGIYLRYKGRDFIVRPK